MLELTVLRGYLLVDTYSLYLEESVDQDEDIESLF